jgi:hypothetical protein
MLEYALKQERYTPVKYFNYKSINHTHRLRYSQQLDGTKSTENAVPPQAPAGMLYNNNLFLSRRNLTHSPVTLPSTRLVRSNAKRETLKKYVNTLNQTHSSKRVNKYIFFIKKKVFARIGERGYFTR